MAKTRPTSAVEATATPLLAQQGEPLLNSRRKTSKRLCFRSVQLYVSGGAKPPLDAATHKLKERVNTLFAFFQCLWGSIQISAPAQGEYKLTTTKSRLLISRQRRKQLTSGQRNDAVGQSMGWSDQGFVRPTQHQIRAVPTGASKESASANHAAFAAFKIPK